jgi:hypothetical protein
VTLLWPHEADLDTRAFEAVIGPMAREMISLARLRIRAMATPEPGRSLIKREFTKRWFRVYNSLCPWVEGKYEFTQLVRELGYLAPDSVIVSPGDSIPDISAIECLDPASAVRFCKPRFDSFGRGLHVARSPEDALHFAAKQCRPYLVQSFLPPTHGEWRYILHRTPEDLTARRPPTIRVAATKLGPVVTGNGRYTVKQLIAANRAWPIADRRKLMMAASTRVPEPGERVELVNSGNISRKLHRFAIPDQDELARVDGYMLAFLASLEELVGGRFGTICVDLGMTERGTVFYELQIPFGNPYGRSSGTGNKHAAARTQLVKSMYLSGQVV